MLNANTVGSIGGPSDVMGVVKGIAMVIFGTGAIIFALFQKKMLSKPVSKIVSQVINGTWHSQNYHT